VLAQLENLEIDAGVTYLDNEPLGRVTRVPLYREHYRLLTSVGPPLGESRRVTWAEVAQVPLCLLTPEHAEPPHHRRLCCARGRRRSRRSNRTR
jgi:DNA-binding transcriptional LysR family regulator